ncbi:hypothetical protein AGMMS50225_14570 [Betaproteobacteria bacterium]|nr:hypothetical protein AGMMS50225_14570 [Betaproteobacteria bacterium]
MSIPTFDQILPIVKNWRQAHDAHLNSLAWLLINRDLNGRVRLILPKTESDRHSSWDNLASTLRQELGLHAYLPDRAMLLYETSFDIARQGAAHWKLEGFANTWVVDRLATEGDWASIAPESEGTPRFVFFSIKGGVGRSTALAATAWRLAQAGKRVLVLDLDLESPGLSSSLLPSERQPTYGITDWLVEDLVGNADILIENMFATSELSHDGEIYVVPAHGAEPGEYVSKLGRVWMPKVDSDGVRESWSARLQRLLARLEDHILPDVVLIDSRAGIDEVASTCVTDLGAKLVLLFAMEGSQTWTGYRILFEHWRQRGVVEEMRERLQIVGAMLPELDQVDYLENLRDHGYELFAESLYDEIPPGEAFGERWHFEAADEVAPHYPWAVKWHRSFAGLRSLQGRLAAIDAQEVNSIFGPLINGLVETLGEID